MLPLLTVFPLLSKFTDAVRKQYMHQKSTNQLAYILNTIWLGCIIKILHQGLFIPTV